METAAVPFGLLWTKPEDRLALWGAINEYADQSHQNQSGRFYPAFLNWLNLSVLHVVRNNDSQKMKKNTPEEKRAVEILREEVIGSEQFLQLLDLHKSATNNGRNLKVKGLVNALEGTESYDRAREVEGLLHHHVRQNAKRLFALAAVASGEVLPPGADLNKKARKKANKAAIRAAAAAADPAQAGSAGAAAPTQQPLPAFSQGMIVEKGQAEFGTADDDDVIMNDQHGIEGPPLGDLTFRTRPQ